MGKYFKYAIGEILLVVIGILIALQINNWNENSKNEHWEQHFLKDLENEIQADFEQLEHTYRVQKNKGDACSELLRLIQEADESKKKRMDSIFSSIQAVNPTFFPTTGVYDTAISAGKLELVKNDSLKYLITNLYNHYYKRLVYNGEILDQVVEKVDWEKSSFYRSETKEIKSWDAAMNPDFYNQINFLKDQNIVYSSLVKSNIAQIKKVIDLINEEVSLTDD